MAEASCKEMGLTGGRIAGGQSIERECFDSKTTKFVHGCGDIKDPEMLKHCLPSFTGEKSVLTGCDDR